MTTKRNLLFPEVEDIPKRFALESPVVLDRYLINGTLKRWKGPYREVTSPIGVRSSTKVRPCVIGKVPLLTNVESMMALDGARKAFDSGRGIWPSMSYEERTRSVEEFLTGMRKRREEMAHMLMWEIAKPIGDCLKEFDRTVAYVKDTIKALGEQEGSGSRPVCTQGILGNERRVPLGVVLCMGPYNYPLYETFTALAPALLTGNTVIIKAPRFGTLLFKPLLLLFQEAFPKGAVNVLFGTGKEIAPALMSSGMVDVLAFIGTSDVADSLKRLHPKQHRLRSVLGLQAKNPAIILPDADLDVAAKESVLGAFAFNGQRCAAIKVVFVHSSVVDAFMERFIERTAGLRCGMPWEEGVFVTPLVGSHKTSYLAGLVEDALRLGARIVNRGGGTSEATFFYPTVLYPANTRMRICHEEQFGPVVPIVPYDDIAEPLRYAVESNYGQQASVFGRDPRMIARVTETLAHQVSRININCKCQRTPDTFPFTGRKDSAEGVLSVNDALQAFTMPAFVAARDTKEGREILAHIARKR